MYPDNRNPYQLNQNQNPQYGNPYPTNQNPQYGNPYPPNQNPQYGNPYPTNQNPQYGNPCPPNQNPQYGNPYPPNYNQRPADNRKKEEPGKGFAVASMVLGLISLVLFCTGINVITAILAIIFGIVYLVKRRPEKGMAIVGIITGTFGIIAFVIYWALIIRAAGSVSGADDFLRRYEYQFDGEMKAPEDYEDLEDYLQHNYENF